MFHLTRQVRFAINDVPDDQWRGPPSNSYGGFPSLTGAGRYFAADITVAGELEPRSQYLMNIKAIDSAVRELLPEIQGNARNGAPQLAIALFKGLWSRWPEKLRCVALWSTPFLCYSISEGSMIQLSQKFEFSASHRLHNPLMSDGENRQMFGKCNNPSGHGHNYEVQVTLTGEVDPATGVLIELPTFERTVAQTVIERFDHKHLNTEVPQFSQIIPSVENIARVIFELLEPALRIGRCRVASVTVWETPKTWCEYAPLSK